MNSKLMLLLAAVSMWLVICSGTFAGKILQPLSASTSMSTYPGFLPGKTRDQSGLSLTYQSLVSSFDAYVASHPTHYHGFGANTWGTNQGVRSGNFDFDLGGTFAIESIALWNLDTDPSAIGNFDLLADDNSSFSSPQLLGNFTPANPVPPGQYLTSVEVFNFDPTNASFVRLAIKNSRSLTSFGLAFSEAAFEVVPEPMTVFLLCAGSAFFALRRR
jgi:hypothetical protein